MQETPIHAVKEIPAYAGMTVFRTTLKCNAECTLTVIQVDGHSRMIDLLMILIVEQSSLIVILNFAFELHNFHSLE